MKKEKNLRIFLYVVTILSLIYTCFTVFQAYGTFASYYQGMPYGFMDIFAYVISSSYAPICFTLIFYVMIAALDIWCARVEGAAATGAPIHFDEMKRDAVKDAKAVRDDAKKEAREQFKDEKDLTKAEKDVAKAAVDTDKDLVDSFVKAQKKSACEQDLDREERREVDAVMRDQKEAARQNKREQDHAIDEAARQTIKDAKANEKAVDKAADEAVKDVKKSL